MQPDEPAEFEDVSLTEESIKVDPDFEDKLEFNRTKSVFTKNYHTGKPVIWEKPEPEGE